MSEPDEICPACIEQAGLCARHAPSVLPQLAQPGWYRLVGESHYSHQKEKESPEGKRVRERKERKRARAAARLVAAVQGVFTRSHPSLEAA